ncbi:MAG TPA: DnaJ domain-containing protein [Thermoanaerobaculia bacterium]|nr:DnaJ domain-containing protein [Thermoanaerobaculia bacterium]
MSRDVDYYALLGVTRDAKESEIRERFRTLAREAHPDRASRDHKAEAEAKFQDLTEAVNVLTNPSRRKSYDFEQAFKASGAASADADSVTQSLLARGMQAYKEREFADAAGNFQLAVHRNPNDPKAQHYLGLAAARSGDMRTAVKALETAISLEPHNVPLLKDAGAVFRQAGLLIKAEKAYQEALRWDPSAGEVRKALEEVRAKRAVKS